MHIKHDGANVTDVAAYELTNRIVNKPSYMYELDNTVDGSNEGNMDYHQSVAERHHNLVLKFSYLKELDDVDPFNIIGLEKGK